MKVLAILSVICLLVFLNAAHVECRRSPTSYQMFVFGDSFADTGNVPKSNLSQDSRQWYYPYGIDRPSRSPSGRFSDSWVQTDFIAAMFLGRQEAPPVYWLGKDGYIGSFGMNFAVSGAGVYEVPQKVPTLRRQVGQFQRMKEEGIITESRLKQSIALVAISGNDYAALVSSNDSLALVGNVTTEIAKEVKRLHDLGVPKIIVNNLHPLGCAPRLSRASNYTSCDNRANTVASIHNKNLTEKLLGPVNETNVMLLDLNTAFSRIVQPGPANNRAENDLSKTIKNRLRPCCESFDPKGYCGQKDENGHSKYRVVDMHKEYGYCFYWDDVHPAHAAWLLVMTQLAQDIGTFLDIF